MRNNRRERLVLRDPRQQEALASTVRMELLEHLHATGPASVAGIARRMGRSPNSLYHHFRRLEQASLIRQVGSRQSGAREQALYDVVAEVFELSGEPATKRGTAAERKTIGVVLRKAEREFAAALEADPEEMRTGKFYAGRARARLSRAAQKEVYRHLQSIQKIFSDEFYRQHHPRTKLRTCSFTVAFVPSPSGSDEDGPPPSGRERGKKRG